jgi:two-component system cell cycle response regulator
MTLMPRHVRLILVLTGGWIAACEAHALGLRWLPIGPQKWLHLVAMGIGAALCLVRAGVRPRERMAWFLIGLGVLAWACGELYFTVVLWNDSSPPVPSPADGGYLSLPPLIFLGLILLARSRIKGLPKTIWADGVTAGLAAGALSAAIVFKPVLAAVTGNSLSVATNLSYPIMDLIMLGFIAGVLAVGGWRVDRRFGVIAAGVMCFWTADTIYLIKAAEGTWVSGGPYDPGWWTIAVCCATAAWMQPRGRAARARSAEAISVSIASALVSLGILVVGTVADVTLPAIVLASGALLCVLLRLVLTFRAHQTMLRRTTHEALTDPLTGLGNRRAFAAALGDRLEDDDPEPLVLALFDLDGFKSYNDNFGHAAGDALLQRLAAGLQTEIGAAAGVYRMGGDEFCALLPGGEDGEALLRAALGVLSDHGDGFSIKASLGSVRLPEETTDLEEALRLADQRMYAHKSQGRRATAALEVKHALLSALAHRDPELSDHVDDVAELAAGVATSLGCDPAQVEAVRIAAELHDIGKIAIPEAILDKPGPLTPDEWTLMHQHTIAGERIILASPALADVAPLVRSSHERWDGTGYPDQLAGESIPLGARIITVCDSYHAMTSDRTYRRALSVEVALTELCACAGSQFDPSVVEAFLRYRAAAAAAAKSAPAHAEDAQGEHHTVTAA